MMDDPSINVPKSLEELRKVQRLGVGSYGTVYLVQSLATGEYYALKELPKSRMLAGEFQRVMTEIELLKSVDHPLIVQTFGTFQDDNFIYILMEWAAGGELFHHIHTRQRLTNEQARFHAAQVILAVEYLHNKNIVYRDIKPENILVNSKGHIQLVDFGFAKRIPDGKTLTLCGTPEYLAPEVVEGKEYGFSADWWSVGVLIFEMLSGYSPFYNENVMDIFHNITKGKVEYPSFFEKNAVDMIKGLLTLNPQKRFSIVEIKRHAWLKGFNWDIRTMQSPMISEISTVNIAKTEEKVDYWGIESEVSDGTEEGEEDKEADEDDFVCEEGEVLNLTKLIARATQEDLAQHPNYRTIVDDLVYTCWNFCEPQVFVRKLIERFFGPTKGSSKRNIVQFKKTQDFIQSRILFILRRWIPLLTAIELEAPWQSDEPTTNSENDVDSENSEIEADFVEDAEQGLSRLSSKLTRTTHLSVVDPIIKFVFTTSNDTDAVPTLEDTLTNFIRFVESSGSYSSSLLDAVTSVKHKPLTVIFNTVYFGQSDYLSRISSVQSVLAPLSHARSLTSSGPQSRTQSLNSSSTSSLMSMPSSWVGVELTPEEIANQTTEMEKKLFCAIDVREMLSRPWDNKEACPSISRLVNNFNWTSRWVVTQIMKQDSPQGRARAISTFIHTAVIHNSQGNFTGIMEILSGLRSAPVSRLKETWLKVSPNMCAELDHLENMMSPEHDYTLYRERLKLQFYQGKPCIPYFGVLLGDVHLVDATVPIIINGNINYDYVKVMGARMREMKQHQQSLTVTTSKPGSENSSDGEDEVHGYDVYTMQAWHEDELYRISQLREETPGRRSSGEGNNNNSVGGSPSKEKGVTSFIGRRTSRTSAMILSWGTPKSGSSSSGSTSPSSGPSSGTTKRASSGNIITPTLVNAPHSNYTITSRDFQILFSFSITKTFEHDQIVIAKNTPMSPENFYLRIISGKVSIISGNNTQVAFYNPGDTLGDSLILSWYGTHTRSYPAQFSAKAVGTTVVQYLNLPYVERLLQSDMLAARFFKYVATNLASLLRKQTLSFGSNDSSSSSLVQDFAERIPPPIEDVPTEKEQIEGVSIDSAFANIFNLGPEEIVVKVYSGKLGLLSGVLFVSIHHICFFAKAFGLTRKLAIPLSAIKDVRFKDPQHSMKIISDVSKEIGKDKKTTERRADFLKKRKFIFKDDEEYKEALNIIPNMLQASDTSRTPNISSFEIKKNTEITRKSKEIMDSLSMRDGAFLKLDPSDVLSSADWTLILKGSKLMTFPPGTTLVEEGVKPRQLFQIISGVCLIQKWAQSEHITIARRHPGEVFGEVSFLDGPDSEFGATASVVTETIVEVYLLGEHFMNILLGLYPNLAPRFYRYLGTLVTNRIFQTFSWN